MYKGLLNYTGNVTEWYDEETTAARDLAQVADSVANVLYRLAMNGTDNTTRLEVNVTTVRCFSHIMNQDIIKFVLICHKTKQISCYKSIIMIFVMFLSFFNSVLI